SNQFGLYFVRLPLKKAAKIVHGNSLRIDWESVVTKEKLNFILGNPPFVGKHLQNTAQKADMELVFDYLKGLSDLDYVTAWFYKAALFIQNTVIEVGFVATSSITQGEQVYLLWNPLINNFRIKINFAHRTFKWTNEAKGNAVVHCVIIGFSLFDRTEKAIFDYENINSDPQKLIIDKINPYLSSGSLILISKRSKPLSDVSPITCGNKPSDDGNFIFTDTEKNEFIKKEPLAQSLFRKYIGSTELINNTFRWCLWLKDIPPVELKKLPLVLERIDKVKKFRENSTAAPTRKTALTPSLFFYISHPDTNYLAIPEVSSERRKYIPIGFLDKSIIPSNKLQIIPHATLYLFGILTSEMHMTWVRYVCGRLKSDFDYSNTIVYNNYPFPENISEKQKKKVETAAQAVLDTRAKYPDSSLADLYDPLTMPPDLVKAHQALDKAVDLCYRPQPFVSELNRIEYLFSLYEALTVPLLKVEKKKRANKKDIVV
ncbi:MAG: type IIL restriction-modification enzyme MmeI, partial [Pseudanabaena sp. ELA607]